MRIVVHDYGIKAYKPVTNGLRIMDAIAWTRFIKSIKYPEIIELVGVARKVSYRHSL